MASNVIVICFTQAIQCNIDKECLNTMLTGTALISQLMMNVRGLFERMVLVFWTVMVYGYILMSGMARLVTYFSHT